MSASRRFFLLCVPSGGKRPILAFRAKFNIEFNFFEEVLLGRSLSLAEIFQLGYYWESKVLLTAVKLDLFGILASSAATAVDVAKRLQTSPQSTELLMNALVAIGLLQKDGLRYANTTEAQSFLVKESPSYAGHLLILQDAEWKNWGELETAVRTGQSPVKEHLFRSDPGMAENVLMVLHRVALQHAPN